MLRSIWTIVIVVAALISAVAAVHAAPPTRPGGGGTGSTCDDTYKSCKSHCNTYGRDSSAFQTCITNCKKERDRCKPPVRR